MESYWDLLPKEIQLCVDEFCWCEELICGRKYKVWKQNGCYHRDNDLPATIDANGSQFWYKEGKLHRDNDLPAVIYSDGGKHWYKEGKRHRDNNLPAIIHYGSQGWYKNGKFIS